MIQRVLVGFFMLIFSTPLLALSASHSVSPNSGVIGDRFEYRFEARYPTSERLVQTPQKEDFYPFEVVDQSIQKETIDGVIHISLITYLQLFDASVTALPTQSVTYKRKKKVIKKVLPPIPLTIESTLVADIDGKVNIEGLKPPQSLEFPLGDLIKTVLFFCGMLIVILGGGYWWWLKHQPKQEDVVVGDTRDPRLIALESLDTLKSQKFDEQGLYKHHYELLTEILKHYLAVCFNSPIGEMTTYEAIHFIEDKVESQTYKRLKFVLSFSDQVKFAKMIPDETQHRELFQKTIDIIEKVSFEEEDFKS